jgi:reverse gyrase
MRLRRPKGYPKKECSSCGRPLEENRYKKSRYCRKCHAKKMREWRKKKKKELIDLKKKLAEYAPTGKHNT